MLFREGLLLQNTPLRWSSLSSSSVSNVTQCHGTNQKGRKWIFHSIHRALPSSNHSPFRHFIFDWFTTQTHIRCQQHRRKIIYNLIALVNYAYFIIQGMYDPPSIPRFHFIVYIRFRVHHPGSRFIGEDEQEDPGND